MDGGLLWRARADGMKVIAHRGDSGSAPENTLVAFERAVRIGADVVEIDAHMTADGELVVIHDGSVARTTNASDMWSHGDLGVADRSLADLRTLDAGGWFDAAFAGQRIPTLGEAIGTITANDRTGVLLERKAGPAEVYATLIRDSSLLKHVVVQSFDWEFLTEMRQLLPEALLVGLGGGELDEARARELTAVAAAGIAWRHTDVTAAMVEVAHGAGLAVWAWTPDDPDAWQRLKLLEVDGVITNQPGQLIAWRDRGSK